MNDGVEIGHLFLHSPYTDHIPNVNNRRLPLCLRRRETFTSLLFIAVIIIITINNSKGKCKGKVIPLQAWCGSEGG